MDVCAGLFYIASGLLLKTEFGLSDQTIGLIIGTNAIGYLLGTLFCSRVADRLGAENCVRYGSLVICLNNIGFYFSESFTPFLIMILWGGLGHAFFWPGFQAWIGRNVNRRETAHRIGLFSIGWSLGLLAFGPVIGGWALEIDNRLPFLISVFISGSLFLVFHFLKPSLKEHETHDIQIDVAQVPLPIRRRFLFSARLANLMAVMSLVGLRIFFPLLALDWGMSESAIGLVLAVAGVSQSAAFLVLLFTARWHYHFKFLMFGQVIGLLGLLCISIAGTFWLTDNPTLFEIVLVTLPALAAAGVMAGVSFFSSAFYGLFGEIEKGKNAAFNEAIIGFANVLPLYGGAAAIAAFGVMAPYWLGAVTVAAFFGYQWIAVRPTLSGE